MRLILFLIVIGFGCNQTTGQKSSQSDSHQTKFLTQDSVLRLLLDVKEIRQLKEETTSSGGYNEFFVERTPNQDKPSYSFHLKLLLPKNDGTGLDTLRGQIFYIDANSGDISLQRMYPVGDTTVISLDRWLAMIKNK